MGHESQREYIHQGPHKRGKRAVQSPSFNQPRAELLSPSRRKSVIPRGGSTCCMISPPHLQFTAAVFPCISTGLAHISRRTVRQNGWLAERRETQQCLSKGRRTHTLGQHPPSPHPSPSMNAGPRLLRSSPGANLECNRLHPPM